MIQNPSKMASRWLKMPQDCPKPAPSWPKMAPRRPQDGPKMAPRWPQDGPKMAPRWPQESPRWPQQAPRRLPAKGRHPFVAHLDPQRGPQSPSSWTLGTPPKVTTSTRIVHLCTFETMSRQETKVGRLRAGEEGLLNRLIPVLWVHKWVRTFEGEASWDLSGEEGLLHRLTPVLWVPNRPCGGG